MKTIKAFLPGILLCLLIAVPSWLTVSLFPTLEVIGAPVIAIILGMIITLLLKKKDKLAKGITFTSNKILQYAVILLGFGLNLATIGQVGLTSLPIIVSTIATSLIISFIMFFDISYSPFITELYYFHL